jgi:hypothetical protein
MPAQTTIDRFWFGEGTELALSTDNEATYTDVGSFTGGVTLTHSFDKQEIELGNRAKTAAKIKNQTIAVAPTALVSWDLETIKKLGGGIYNYTGTASAKVEDVDQVVAIGWAYNQFIPIANQNGSGAEIVINSVTGGEDGVLTEETDYFKGQSNGVWGIYVIDSATGTTL